MSKNTVMPYSVISRNPQFLCNALNMADQCIILLILNDARIHIDDPMAPLLKETTNQSPALFTERNDSLVAITPGIFHPDSRMDDNASTIHPGFIQISLHNIQLADPFKVVDDHLPFPTKLRLI